jgi:hypothetical protein
VDDLLKNLLKPRIKVKLNFILFKIWYPPMLESKIFNFDQ